MTVAFASLPAALWPLMAAGDSLMPALFLALMIVIWIARQFGDKPPQQRPQPRPPGGPRNQGGPGNPVRQGQPQAARQLQREIEDFLNQVNRGGGQKKPAEQAAEPVFDAPRAERPRRAPERLDPERDAWAQMEEQEALRGQPARQTPVAAPVQPAPRVTAAQREQPRAELLNREAKPSSGNEQKRLRRMVNHQLGSSQLGSSLREHLTNYMGEDHLPQHLRDKLVDEVEAHLGRLTSGASRTQQMKHSLIAALKNPEQVRQAILVHEILAPYSRNRSRPRR